MSLLLGLKAPSRLILSTVRAVSIAAPTRTALAARRVAGEQRLVPLLDSSKPCIIGVRLPSAVPRFYSATATAAATRPPLMDDVPESELPVPFSSIRDKIHKDTYDAITRDPFQYTEMSAVQAAVLPMLPGLAEPYAPSSRPQPPIRDLLVKAKTGTGKTIAFLVPAIEARLKKLEGVGQRAQKDAGMEDLRIARDAIRDFAVKNVGIVIISPTRELAIQIANEAMKLTRHSRLGVHLWVGGENKRRQLDTFEKHRKDIVVATPGRFNDIMEDPRMMSKFKNMNTVRRL